MIISRRLQWYHGHVFCCCYYDRGLGGALYCVTIGHFETTISNAQGMLNDYAGDPERKSIMEKIRPERLFRENVIEKSFAKDKTATCNRNLSMEVYGRLKRPNIFDNLLKYGLVNFQKPRGFVDEQYAKVDSTTIVAQDAIKLYENLLNAEEIKCPKVGNIMQSAAARKACSLAKPAGARTVRDYYRPTQGYGQNLLVARDFGRKPTTGNITLLALICRLVGHGSRRLYIPCG